MSTGEIKTNRKQIVGLVTSTKMDKSITVSVERKLRHPIYGKFVKKSKKFLAHDEKNACNEGDTVRIAESRPLSRRKRWKLVEIIERAK
ncbi:MAG: 30S ribosomal protein S17 [Saprospiraceae bacterium]|nr:30S ribosomal protein S17 [Saprospiraceae bacterium]